MDGRLRVLVVDDNAPFRTAVGEMLTFDDRFVVVGSAASGEAALAWAASSPCDLVVMDVRMPGMGGLAASAALGELVPEVVVVLVSAGDFSEATTRHDGAVFVPKTSLDADALARAFDHRRAGSRGDDNADK
jgi:DNA-binding NarL/FixJ family response regulator